MSSFLHQAWWTIWLEITLLRCFFALPPPVCMWSFLFSKVFILFVLYWNSTVKNLYTACPPFIVLVFSSHMEIHALQLYKCSCSSNFFFLISSAFFFSSSFRNDCWPAFEAFWWRFWFFLPFLSCFSSGSFFYLIPETFPPFSLSTFLFNFIVTFVSFYCLSMLSCSLTVSFLFKSDTIFSFLEP